MKEISIIIDLKNRNDFVSKYNDNTLDPKLRDYILNELVGYDPKMKLNIIIKAKFELSEEEKETYRKILEKEFKESLFDLQLIRKMSNIKRFGLLFIGLACLIINYKLSKYFGEVIREIINIFGWVALWELVYSILFTAISRRKDINRYSQVLKSNISFE